MKSTIRSLAILMIILAVPTTAVAQAPRVEVDPGVWVELDPEPTALTYSLTSHLGGFEFAFDLTHDRGRQSFITFGYTTLLADLTAHGANLGFVRSGPLTLNLLSQYDGWWIEEEWSSVFSAAEKSAMLQYVENGGCLIFNGDEFGLFTSEHGTILAVFGIPYAFVSGASGFTTDITPHFLTSAFPPSGFPDPVSLALIPAPANSLAPVPPALSVVRDRSGRTIVAATTLGRGGVVVFADEMTLDGTIQAGDNRTLGARAFEFCAFGLVVEVSLDIKPGSLPNSIQARSKGVIPVAILTTSTADGDALDFNAWEVDPATVTFGPDGAPIAHSTAHVEDVDLDGDLDMVLHFETQAVGLSCGDTEATLHGTTLDGQAIVGTDSVRIVGCK